MTPSQSTDDEKPTVLGAGGGPRPMPTREEAEAVWRKAFAARLVEVAGLDEESAKEYAEAGDADLSVSPQDAADDELSYWTDDGDGP